LYQDITIEELLQLRDRKPMTLVDVRSPSEFADSTIPGSCNIPLFTDAERAEVGTLYKQVSVDAAKEKGLEIVSAKLPAFIKEFQKIPGDKAVFCWRGGMRSKTTATLLSLMGIRAYRLAGGVRAYRKWVVDTLEHFQFRPRAIVINGYTGTGKTVILRELKAQGYPVLDLEGLAGHRGSIFGHIGLYSRNQKTFDALLLEELLSLNDSPYFLMEGESKRIGKVVMPEFLVQKKEQGKQLFIDLPIGERVRLLVEDYRPEQHKQDCLDAFQKIKKRMHTPIAAEIEAHLQDGRFPEAVRLLLIHYYDPRYQHATSQYGTDRTVIQAETLQEAVQAVIDVLPVPSLTT